jgi:N utilization substance protein A
MNQELIRLVESISRDKSIEKELLFRDLEVAMVSAARKFYGEEEEEFEIEIDRESGDIAATRADGDPLDVRDLGRIAAQTAKQVMIQRIREAERGSLFDEYKPREGTIVTGQVTRVDGGAITINLGRGEGFLPRSEQIPGETHHVGDRIRAMILEVRETPHQVKIVLSRSHPDFVRCLFELEVSEITDGTMEIKGIAREAGYRSKVAVLSHDDRVDPVGACVGMRGMRVKNIVRELSGEKIDIVRWSEDIHTLIANALAPARLKHVDVDEETQTVTVTVEPDQLSLAIGKRGQNARLTSKLTGWRVDIEKDEESMDFEERVAVAVTKLAAIEGIGDEFAEKLVFSGFLTLEGILAAEMGDLSSIEGITPEQAKAIWYAAEAEYIKEHGEITE